MKKLWIKTQNPNKTLKLKIENFISFNYGIINKTKTYNLQPRQIQFTISEEHRNKPERKKNPNENKAREIRTYRAKLKHKYEAISETACPFSLVAKETSASPSIPGQREGAEAEIGGPHLKIL